MSADRLTILAVDDEHTQLEDLARLLRSCPSVRGGRVRVRRPRRTAQGLEPAYDAIFLDVRMPDLDGVELGRVLQALRLAAAARVRERLRRAPRSTRSSCARSTTCASRSAAGGSRRRSSESRRRSRPTRHTATATGTGHTPRQAGDTEMIAVSAARGGSTRLINRGSILYVQSHGDFVRIVTEDGRYLLRSDAERDRAPLGAVRLRPRAPPVRRQPRPRRRATARCSAARPSSRSPTARRSRSRGATWPS